MTLIGTLLELHTVDSMLNSVPFQLLKIAKSNDKSFHFIFSPKTQAKNRPKRLKRLFDPKSHLIHIALLTYITVSKDTCFRALDKMLTLKELALLLKENNLDKDELYYMGRKMYLEIISDDADFVRLVRDYSDFRIGVINQHKLLENPISDFADLTPNQALDYWTNVSYKQELVKGSVYKIYSGLSNPTAEIYYSPAFLKKHFPYQEFQICPIHKLVSHTTINPYPNEEY